MSTVPTMLGTVLRGLRARALLSAGSVLLTALAIGSAVLGPIFQDGGDQLLPGHPARTRRPTTSPA